MTAASPWPLHIRKALASTSTLTLHEQDDLVEAFKRRWGDLELHALERATESEIPQERIFALFALGYLGAQEARPAIRAAMGGMNPEER